MQHDVFISYASEMRTTVEDLATTLEKAGLSVWWDRNLLSGDNYTVEIEQALRQSRLVIVLWDPISVSSDWVMGEAKIARETGSLVALKTADLDVTSIPPPYNTLHSIDLQDSTALFDAIEKKLDRPVQSRLRAHLGFQLRRRAKSARRMIIIGLIVVATMAVMATGLAIHFEMISKAALNEALARARTVFEPCAGRLIPIGSLDDPEFVCSLVNDAPAQFRDCENCPLMVALPDGKFLIGSDPKERGRNTDEGPRKPIFVSGFAIGRYEVSEGEWAACEEAGRCKPLSRDVRRDNLPARPVSWENAASFVAWLKQRTGREYRLPTEAEWEYAARAKSTGARYWGQDPSGACEFANVRDLSYRRNESTRRLTAEELVAARRASAVPHDCDDRFSGPAPVGSFMSNGFSLHDVMGNVWEWTQDCATPDYRTLRPDASTIDKPGCVARSIRGGSYASGQSSIRSANRYQAPVRTERTPPDVGLRIARTLLE
jgi:formylglycine-generating enzyme required for sulfatase activity